MSAAEHPDRIPPEEDLATVIIPAKDEEEHISTCLDSILAQTHTALQVLVVDGLSEDRTREIVRDYARRDPRVELLENPKVIVSAALNVALAEAKGKWLVRVDAHSTIPPDYVATIVAHLRSGLWGGVGGRKEAVGVTATGRAIAAALGSRFGVGNSYYHYGRELRPVDHVPFGAYPVPLARELGGWDEELEVNQDYEFDYRLRQAGFPLLFDPRLVIWWLCRQTLTGFFRQYRRYGKGKAKVALLHPRSVQPRHLAAPALITSWVAAGAVGMSVPWLGILLASPYFVALPFASLQVAGRLDDPRAKVAVPAAFLVMHVSWGLGFLGGTITHLWSRLREGSRSPVPDH